MTRPTPQKDDRSSELDRQLADTALRFVKLEADEGTVAKSDEILAEFQKAMADVIRKFRAPIPDYDQQAFEALLEKQCGEKPQRWIDTWRAVHKDEDPPPESKIQEGYVLPAHQSRWEGWKMHVRHAHLRQEVAYVPSVPQIESSLGIKSSEWAFIDPQKLINAVIDASSPMRQTPVVVVRRGVQPTRETPDAYEGDVFIAGAKETTDIGWLIEIQNTGKPDWE